jgi:hypothetical protein
MKSSKKMEYHELSKKQKPRQPIEGSEIPPPWVGHLLGGIMENMKVFIKDEIEKARLKPEQNKKMRQKKQIKKTVRKLKKIKNKGIDQHFKECC